MNVSRGSSGSYQNLFNSIYGAQVNEIMNLVHRGASKNSSSPSFMSVLNQKKNIDYADIEKKQKCIDEAIARRDKAGELEFGSKEEALKYVKENYDLTNCTLAEFMEARAIIGKNKLIPVDKAKQQERIIPLFMINMNVPELLKAGHNITNPVYLRGLNGEKCNWYSHFEESASQQQKLGNPKGARNIREQIGEIQTLLNS